MQQMSLAIKRKRKFLTVAPILVIPFLTMAFWALGGGRNGDLPGISDSNSGLNMELPDPSFKEGKQINKMGYYEKAAADSIRLHGMMKDDPYYQPEAVISKDGEAALSFEDHFNLLNARTGKNSLGTATGSHDGYSDPNEAKIYNKLAQLNSVLSNSGQDSKLRKDEKTKTSMEQTSDEIQRLETMIEGMNGQRGDEDPELDQLNTMLNKIIEVQHPERTTQPVAKNEAIMIADTVSNTTTGNVVQMIDSVSPDVRNSSGFYGVALAGEFDKRSNAIEAVVHETQTVVAGSVVKMRLVQDLYISEVRILKGAFVYGVATLSSERLNISVTSILDQGRIYHVKMNVYDLDGIAGIYIPGAITRDVAKQSANNSIQGLGLSAIDPSVSMQAANAAIETAKSLLSKKAKLVKVQLNSGHRIFLNDQNVIK